MNRISRLFSVTVILPVYKGILIQVKKEGMMITVTDGTVSMKEFINSEIEIFEYGECVVDGKLFFEIIKKMDDEFIWVRKDANQLKMKSGKAEMKLLVFQNGEYPHINFEYPEIKFQVNSEVLQKAINSTIFAANDQQTRPVLGGLNFMLNDDSCTIVGTDSYRLAKVEIPVISSNQISITIPKKMLSLFSMLFPDNQDVFVYFNNHKALIASENIIIQSVLLDGVYPNASSLIPQSFETEIELPTEQLLKALDRASFCKDDGITVVSFDLLTDEIVLTSESSQIGSSIESVPYISVTGNKEVKFYCNEQFFADALKALGGQTCVLYFNSDFKPFVFTNGKNDGHVQLLLPVRHQ